MTDPLVSTLQGIEHLQFCEYHMPVVKHPSHISHPLTLCHPFHTVHQLAMMPLILPPSGWCVAGTTSPLPAILPVAQKCGVRTRVGFKFWLCHLSIKCGLGHITQPSDTLFPLHCFKRKMSTWGPDERAIPIVSSKGGETILVQSPTGNNLLWRHCAPVTLSPLHPAGFPIPTSPHWTCCTEATLERDQLHLEQMRSKSAGTGQISAKFSPKDWFY